METGTSNNPMKNALVAKKMYADRQIDKFVKWSMATKSKVKYKELIEVINNYKQ